LKKIRAPVVTTSWTIARNELFGRDWCSYGGDRVAVFVFEHF